MLLSLEDLYSKCNGEAVTRAIESDFLVSQPSFLKKECHTHPRFTFSLKVGDASIITYDKIKLNLGSPDPGEVISERWRPHTQLEPCVKEHNN